jgi:EmrB/QacA subfamily drug resistance transporter
MLVLIFASFMDLLDVTIVQVALPTIQTDLKATPANLEWIVSGYMLAFAIVLITGGRLGDIIGRQRVFLIGIAGFTLASVGACLAPTGDALVLARVIQGSFAALMVPQVLASLQALFTPKERAPLLGLIGGVSGLAAVVGPLLGGWLVSSNAFGIGWRSIFLINVPVGILAFIAALVWVPNSKSAHPLRLDVVGVIVSAVGLVAVIYPVIEGRSLGWPAWGWVMLGVGLVILVLFVLHQRRRERRDGSALLPITLFSDRGFSFGLITQATFQGAMNAFSITLLIYVQSALHFSALGAGLTLLPFSIGAFLGTGVSIPLTARAGKLLMFVGGLLQAGALVWIMPIVSARGAALTGWDLVWPMVVAGVGLGLLVVPLVDVALARVPLGSAGAATGAYSTMQQVGAALGIAVVGVVFFGVLGTTFTQARFEQAFLAGAWVAVAGYAIAAVSSLALPGRADILAHRAAEEKLIEESEASSPVSVAPLAG